MRKASPAAWLDYNGVHGRALLASGRGKEAVAIYAQELDKIAHPEMVDVYFYAALLKASGEKSPPRSAEYYVAKIAKPEDRPWVSILTWGNVSEEQLRLIKDPKEKAAALVATAAWRSADEMLARAKGGDTATFTNLPQETMILLAGEAYRLEEDDLYDAVMAAANFPVEEDVLLDYLDEGDESLLAPLDPGFRAAIRAVRARVVKGGARDSLNKQALAEDFAQTVVSAAVKGWKKP